MVPIGHYLILILLFDSIFLRIPCYLKKIKWSTTIMDWYHNLVPSGLVSSPTTIFKFSISKNSRFIIQNKNGRHESFYHEHFRERLVFGIVYTRNCLGWTRLVKCLSCQLQMVLHYAYRRFIHKYEYHIFFSIAHYMVSRLYAILKSSWKIKIQVSNTKVERKTCKLRSWTIQITSSFWNCWLKKLSQLYMRCFKT